MLRQYGFTVDADSTTNGPGTEDDWSDAFKYLQDAMDWAHTHQGAFEIRVAEGVYKPNQAQFATIPTNQREATFKIQRNDVVLLGGYAGVGAPNPNARNIALYLTILSGDLDDDDIPVDPQTGDLIFQNYDENSYNVVTTTGVNQSVVLGVSPSPAAMMMRWSRIVKTNSHWRTKVKAAG